MPPEPKRRMKEALGRLAKDPAGRTTGLDVRQLDVRSDYPVHRLRMGDWRAAWFVRDGNVEVIRIFHRSEGYGWLERRYP